MNALHSRRCHSGCITQRWEGAQPPLSQPRLSLSPHPSDFLLLVPLPRRLCSPLEPPAFHVSMQLPSLHLSRWLGRGPTSLAAHRQGGVVLQPRSSSSPNHQHCKTGAGGELQVPEPCPRCPSACPVCLPELQEMSLSVWMVSRALQCVKKPLFLESFFSDGGQALLEAKLKACQTGSKMQTPG